MQGEDSVPPLGEPNSGFEIIRLSASDFELVRQALDNPRPPNAKLRAALAALPQREIPQAETDELAAMLKMNWNRACDAGLVPGPKYELDEDSA